MDNKIKTEAELYAYIKAQEQSLIEVSKKITSLEQENEKLRKIISGFDSEKNSERTLYLKEQEYTDAEIISVTQIELLRKTSEERELTFEEAKKLDQYIKVLEQVRKKDKNKDDKSKDLPTEDLLRIVSGGGSED